MPTYDFKCKECNLVKEETMSFEESEKGITCECGGLMERQFTPTTHLTVKWNTPYKKGLDAKRDRLEAFKGLDEKKKLPKGITPENANFADLM